MTLEGGPLEWVPLEGSGQDGCRRRVKRAPAPLIMIKRFPPKDGRSAVMLPRKSAPDAVYCVELLLYTIILHIQLALQDLIYIIGSLMKLALWNKKK